MAPLAGYALAAVVVTIGNALNALQEERREQRRAEEEAEGAKRSQEEQIRRKEERARERAEAEAAEARREVQRKIQHAAAQNLIIDQIEKACKQNDLTGVSNLLKQLDTETLHRLGQKPLEWVEEDDALQQLNGMLLAERARREHTVNQFMQECWDFRIHQPGSGVLRR